MTDFNDFQYADEPFSKSKTFVIRPLSEQGFKTYLSNNSFVHNFIPNKPNSRGTSRNINKVNENSVNVINVINGSKNDDQVEQHALIKTEFMVDRAKTVNFPDEAVTNATNATLSQLRKFSPNRSVTSAKVSINTNKTNADICKRMTLSFSHNRAQSSKPVNHFGKSQIKNNNSNNNRFKEDINCKLNEINLNLTSGEFYKSASKINPIRLTNSIGFMSSRVPRIMKEESKLFKLKYTEKIAKTVSGLGKANSNNADIVLEMEVEKENEKLKKILNSQTNPSFLIKANLPKISLIAHQPNVVIKQFNKGNTKYLGEKYNPYENIGSHKNWIARNYYGSLFQH